MREWGMVVVRRRPEATHAPVGAIPTALFDCFFVALWRCGVGQWQLMPGQRRLHGPVLLFL
jgi:hypothetical protein